MDIAGLSSSMSAERFSQQVSLSVAKMAMNTAKQNGAALTDLMKTTQMQRSVTPHKGGNIDLRL